MAFTAYEDFAIVGRPFFTAIQADQLALIKQRFRFGLPLAANAQGDPFFLF